MADVVHVHSLVCYYFMLSSSLIQIIKQKELISLLLSLIFTCEFVCVCVCVCLYIQSIHTMTGIAQVGHLWLVGSMNEEYHAPHLYKHWEELNNKLTVRTVAIEALQTTTYLQHGFNNDVDAVDEDGYDVATKGKAFILNCGATMCTTCFALDVVPGLGRYTEEMGIGYYQCYSCLEESY